MRYVVICGTTEREFCTYAAAMRWLADLRSYEHGWRSDLRPYIVRLPGTPAPNEFEDHRR